MFFIWAASLFRGKESTVRHSQPSLFVKGKHFLPKHVSTQTFVKGGFFLQCCLCPVFQPHVPTEAPAATQSIRCVSWPPRFFFWQVPLVKHVHGDQLTCVSVYGGPWWSFLSGISVMQVLVHVCSRATHSFHCCFPGPLRKTAGGANINTRRTDWCELSPVM